MTADALAQLLRIEAELNIEFPADYRQYVGAFDALERDFGGSDLALWTLDDIVSRNLAYKMSDVCPGLVIIGSDGGGEAVGFDFRRTPPPIVLVNFISSGWHEATIQASTFNEFMTQREIGKPYKFDP